jgi:hypothetical protein
LTAAERDSQRVGHDATRERIEYRELHLRMTLREVLALASAVTPIENGCAESSSARDGCRASLPAGARCGRARSRGT